MSGSVWYIDTSALIKTLVDEAESDALSRWLQYHQQLAACDITRVEAARAIRASTPEALPLLRVLMGELVMIRLDDNIYETAATLDPPSLRSLDAIHLASALSIGADLAGILTYDARMTRGARSLGLHVESPGAPASGG